MASTAPHDPPKTPRGRGRPKQSTEERTSAQADIIRVARSLFAENGYDGVSMRRVADQAACAPSALYRYFPSKRALLRFIWEEIFADLGEHLHGSAHAATTPLAQLGDISLAYLDFWMARPDDFRAIFLIQDRADTEADGFFAQTSKAVQGLTIFTQAIQHAQEDGSLTQRDTAVVRDILFSALQGALMNVITIPEYTWADPDQLGRLTLEVTLRGLGAPADFSLRAEG